VTGNTAVVRHVFTGESERAGKMATTNVGAMLIWQKQDGNWKLLARQAYRLK
jgi:ketosteroid isomerase-like protein